VDGSILFETSKQIRIGSHRINLIEERDYHKIIHWYCHQSSRLCETIEKSLTNSSRTTKSLHVFALRRLGFLAHVRHTKTLHEISFYREKSNLTWACLGRFSTLACFAPWAWAAPRASHLGLHSQPILGRTHARQVACFLLLPFLFHSLISAHEQRKTKKLPLPCKISKMPNFHHLISHIVS
jgi:hypothetical protein